MGGNQSKSVCTTVVENSIKATLDVSISRSSISNNSQTLNMSGNIGTVQDGVDMKQTVVIKIKSSSTTEASTKFQSSIEAQLKERLKQAGETVATSKNNSITIQNAIHKFAVDSSKVFTDNISMIVSNSQTANISGNVNSHLKKVNMSQTVDAAIDAISKIVTSDAAVQTTKAILDKELEQKTEGFAGIIRTLGDAYSKVLGSSVGPMVCVIIILILGGGIYLLVRSGM